ncbi:MAG: hypothetical protein IKJ99_02575 [Oscillospiraceae bacterium]|nr:hypothetical protein [Oscillospiraceae bacterium]
MKKLIAMLLALVLVLSLAACGAEENSNEDLVITRAPEAEATDAPEAEGIEEAPAVEEGMYTLTVDGVELIPGAAFDPAVLGEAASVYEVPSCAIEGTDNVYNYETFEITAYDDGTGEVIYSIYFLDPSLTTTEGLALGDDEAKVAELYGENYEVDGTAYVYTKTGSQLFIIVENGSVVSIEYRMVVA